MDYKVIQGENRQEFERLVREHLNDGWELVGGVSTVVVPIEAGSFVTGFFQSVVKAV